MIRQVRVLKKIAVKKKQIMNRRLWLLAFAALLVAFAATASAGKADEADDDFAEFDEDEDEFEHVPPTSSQKHTNNKKSESKQAHQPTSTDEDDEDDVGDEPLKKRQSSLFLCTFLTRSLISTMQIAKGSRTYVRHSDC